MSSPFSYEIDERNLRIQLKNMEIAQREEAWQKFEAFAQQHPLETASTGFSGVQLKINRNAVVPVIFATVIIVFAAILYNFVSIDKNKEEQSSSTATPNSEITTAELPAAAENKPVSTEPKPIETKPEQATVTTSASLTQAQPAVEAKPTKSEIVEQPKPKKPVEESMQQVQKPQSDSTAPAQEPTVKKKRNRKRDEEAMSALKPTVVSEDETPVEIPQ